MLQPEIIYRLTNGHVSEAHFSKDEEFPYETEESTSASASARSQPFSQHKIGFIA